MSSIVWISLPFAQAPFCQVSEAGSAPSAMPARRRAFARIFSAALAMAAGAPPDSLTWADGAWANGDSIQTIEQIALYAHGTGELPPGVEGGLDAQAVYRD